MGNMGTFLELESIRKTFGSQAAVDGVNLSVDKGEVFSLLGPSGCGKTTLLRMIAGFIRPDEGRIILDGQDITDLPPNKRQINTVFQNYALFPHLSLRENIAFGPRAAGWAQEKIRAEVERMLALVDMEVHADKKPNQISGGQKQRIAIVRALINQPRILLLDEPLAALDLKLRQRMLIELDNIHDEVGITFLYVTHDQSEAMSLSDRVGVMNLGQIEQIGHPVEVYEEPRTGFVASFIGDTNFFSGRVIDVSEDGYCRVLFDSLGAMLCFNDKGMVTGQSLRVTIRPEKFRIGREPLGNAPRENAMHGVVEDVIYLGSQSRYFLRCGPHRISVLQQNSKCLLDEKPLTWKDPAWISWHADDCTLLPGGSEEQVTEEDG